MKVAVTGGAGFIGMNLCRFITGAGRASSVRVLDDLSTGNRENVASLDVEFIKGSILEDRDLDSAVKGMDAIIHLGAIPSVPRSVKAPRASHDANATGTLNVLEAARRNDIGHVVVASSSSVYGKNPKLPKNELDWTRPLSPYAVSKLAAESYALAYQATYGISATAFRFFNVYGPGQSAQHAYAAVIPKFLEAAISRNPLPVEGDGEQSRDFTYVDQVASVLWDTVNKNICSDQPINLAWGTNTTLNELITKIEGLVGYKLERTSLPARTGDVRASQADPSMLKEMFPDALEYSLINGLEKTLEWMRTAERS
jgi:UDP-glucose 4-epimerase